MSERERPPSTPPLPLGYRPPDYLPGTSPEVPPPPVVPRPPDYRPAASPAHALAEPALRVGNSAWEPSTVQLPTPTGEAAAAAEPEEQERVTLAGRLGQDPRLRTTPNGTLIAQFPLGVKDETDRTKTTWHQVLAFQQRAEQVRDRLKKGDVVEVIGYRHERTIPRRNGPRTVAQIYATVVTPRS